MELVTEVEEEATHRELVVLELFRVAVVVLLRTAVVEEDVCVAMLGSVDGMGLPSLVWSFTTWVRKNKRPLLNSFNSHRLPLEGELK